MIIVKRPFALLRKAKVFKVMNELKQLIQSLVKDGYDKISIPQLCFEYRQHCHVALDFEQMRRALVASGIWASYHKTDILQLSALPIVTANFHKLPANETAKALRGEAS